MRSEPSAAVSAADNGRAARFFLLVVILTLPFWLLSGFVETEGIPDNLPVTDIGATFVPAAAALILAYRERGAHGLKELIGRSFDSGIMKPGRRMIPALLLMPAVYCVTYLIMLVSGIGLPVDFRMQPSVLLLLVGFPVAAWGEELGYMGYAIDRLQATMSPLRAGLVMGTFWSLWHLPSMLLIGQSPGLIIMGLSATVAFRVLYVRLYNWSGKSVLLIILVHAVGNIGRSLFPGGRTGFEKADGVIGYSLIILVALLSVPILKNSRKIEPDRTVTS